MKKLIIKKLSNSFLINPKWLYRLILALIMAVICLYMTETLLFFKIKNKKSHLEVNIEKTSRAFANNGLCFEPDRRTPLEVLEELKLKDNNPILLISPYLWNLAPDSIIAEDRHHLQPIGGASKRWTVAYNESGYCLFYFSDKYGFHNPDSIWDNTEIDILLTGDFFAFGVGVQSQKNIAGYLREKYPKTLNLGMPGNGPLRNLASIKETVGEIRPKNVFWFHYQNDWANLLMEKEIDILLNYLEPGFKQNILNKQALIDRKMDDLSCYYASRSANTRNASTPYTFNLSSILKLKYLRDYYSTQKYIFFRLRTRKESMRNHFDLFSKIILEAKRYVEQSGGQFWFVILRNPLAQQVLNKFCQRENIKCIDIHDIFINAEDYEDLVIGHYSIFGYRKIAAQICKLLKKCATQ